MPDRAEPSPSLLRELIDAARRAEAEDAAAELSELDERLHDAWGESIEGIDLGSDLAIDARLALAALDRRLAAAEPDETIHEECLADHLESAAGSLATRGRLDEAETAIRDAREIRQRLFDGAPYDAELRGALAGLLSVVADIAVLRGDRPAAQRAFDEAIAAAREVVEASPADEDLIDSLAAVLWDYAIFQRDGGGLAAAEASYREAAETYGRIPGHDLARRWELSCLDELGDVLSRAGRKPEALAAKERSLILARQRLADEPDDANARSDLADALETFAHTLCATGRHDAEAEALGEVVGIYRSAVTGSADAEARWDLGRALSVLGDAHAGHDDARAAEAFGEAAAIHRTLVAEHPDDNSYLNSLNRALTGLRDAWSEVGRESEALATAQELVPLGRRQTEREPDNDELRRDFAIDLDELGDLLRDAGDRDAAAAAYAEAERILRTALAAEPGRQRARDDLSLCLNRRAIVALDCGDAAGAIAARSESETLIRTLVATAPDEVKWRWRLASCLHGLGSAQEAAGDHIAALAAHEESLTLLRTCRGHFDDVEATLREWLPDAAEAASAAGRPDRAAELRAELDA